MVLLSQGHLNQSMVSKMSRNSTTVTVLLVSLYLHYIVFRYHYSIYFSISIYLLCHLRFSEFVAKYFSAAVRRSSR